MVLGLDSYESEESRRSREQTPVEKWIVSHSGKWDNLTKDHQVNRVTQSSKR